MGIPGGFGSTLIGGLISAMLYGITTLQGLTCITCTTLRIHLRQNSSLLPYGEPGHLGTPLGSTHDIRVLDTLHVSFMCHMVYHYLITDWGIPTSLEYIVWSFPASILVDVVVITIVQIWFARTIYCLCCRQLRCYCDIR
ncbi:hypothetical protein EV401DRAFT_795455 [Pisolithus croceorrhizus]|nr:hypothetical protein EV401DRAFT_795455 [Pisolithus croceorrhizus]